MLEWNDFPVVLAIARCKSLYRAAQVLGVAVSTVMRRIDQIENRAEIPLFQKTDAGYVPTAAGQILISKAEEMEALTEAAARSLQSEISACKNKIRISASEVIGPYFVARHLPTIQEQFPALDVALTVTDQSPSQTAEAFDISLWPSTPSNEDLFGRKLTKVRWALFGARPETEENVVDFFGRAGAERIVPTGVDRIEATSPDLMTNSLIAAAAIVAAARAAAYLPCILGGNWPNLQQLTPPRDHQIGELWAIYRRDDAHKPQVRGVLNVLVAAAALDKDLFLGTSPDKR